MTGWVLAVFVLGAICCMSAAAEDARFAHRCSKDRPAGFDANFADRAAWEKRRNTLRQQALVALGLWPMPPRTPLNPVIHCSIDRDAYTVEKVFFASLPGHYVSGNLYRPKGRAGKLPAVLCPYGHWPDGRFIWRTDAEIRGEIDSGAEKTPQAARSPLQARCAMLARMGCVVFHYDMVGYGDSRKIEHPLGFTDTESVLRLQSFMGLQTWNSIRAVDFVLSLPEVDEKRIAVTGASSGGTQTIALSLADQRLAAVFPVVMVSMNMQGGCVCENAPLYRVGTNNVELAALCAPTPQGVAAAKDWTEDFETRGLPQMKAIYRLYGADDRIEGRFFPYPHNYNLHSRQMMYGFFNKHLKLGWPEPVEEKPFEPIPPAQLSVYDAAHPVPSDATDAAGVRRWMTRASDAQLQALADKPDEYAQVVGAALRAMVVDQMPSAEDVEVVFTTARATDRARGAGADAGEKVPHTELATRPHPAPFPGGEAVVQEGGGLWTGHIARKGTGERIPCRATFPAKWNGAVVVYASVDAPLPQVTRRLLDSGAAVLSIDAYMAGNFRPGPSTRPAAQPPKIPYAAYDLGYNRSIFANRVHDLLTAIALARGWKQTRWVHLLAHDGAGPWALLARILAGDAVDRAAIDLDGFDFDPVRDDGEAMHLPGALKYGGIRGFVPLLAGWPTLLCGQRKGDNRPVSELVDYLLK